MQDKRIFEIKTDVLYKIFEPCNDEKITRESCWGRFYKKCKTKGYCGFSTPCFYNPGVAIIYFYYLYGPMSGMGNVFLVVKENNIWQIKSRIWQWISSE